VTTTAKRLLGEAKGMSDFAAAVDPALARRAEAEARNFHTSTTPDFHEQLFQRFIGAIERLETAAPRVAGLVPRDANAFHTHWLNTRAPALEAAANKLERLCERFD